MATTPVVTEQEEQAQNSLDYVLKTFFLPLYQGDSWEKLSDDMVLDDFTSSYCKALKIDIDSFSSSQEYSERIYGLAFKQDRTYKEICEIGDEIAEKYDYPY